MGGSEIFIALFIKSALFANIGHCLDILNCTMKVYIFKRLHQGCFLINFREFSDHLWRLLLTRNIYEVLFFQRVKLLYIPPFLFLLLKNPEKF